MTAPIPVLEIGGTHVSAAVVDPHAWDVIRPRRFPLDSGADAETILSTLVATADTLDAPAGARWGVAMPDPFDYATGIAAFREVGKFDTLFGVDVGAVLRERVRSRPAAVVFCNDADAFVLGEWVRGSAERHSRCVGITLGTGLGSGWIVDGRITTDGPGIPELGRARTLEVDGGGLEEVVSTRGVRRRYVDAGGDPDLDVREIAGLVTAGDPVAIATFDYVFTALGRGLGPALRAFRADVVIVGGSIAGSWPLIEPRVRAGLAWPDAPPLVLATHPDDAALRGAARVATD